MTEIPEPKDKLDTEVVVSGPEDDAERWRQVDWRRAEADVRRLRQQIFTASRRRFCPPISHQGLLEPDAGKLARPVLRGPRRGNAPGLPARFELDAGARAEA